MDQEDENEDYGAEEFEEEKMGSEETQHQKEEHVNLMVRNIVEELDEIIDIDREQLELNQMFMDEDKEL